MYSSSETASRYVHNRENTVRDNLCFLLLVLISMFCLANVLFKCTKPAFIRNVVTVTVRLRVTQAQVKSRELPRGFTGGGWFWRYFVISFLEVMLAWTWVWSAVSECQFWHTGAPVVVCFLWPVWIDNPVLGCLSLLLTQGYGCLLLENSCAAWSAVSFTATAVHGILKAAARCSMLVSCRANMSHWERWVTLFPFFFFLLF